MKNYINSIGEKTFTEKNSNMLARITLLFTMVIFFYNSPRVLVQNIENIGIAEIFISTLLLFGSLFSLLFFLKTLGKNSRKKIIKFIEKERNVKIFILFLVGLFSIIVYLG